MNSDEIVEAYYRGMNFLVPRRDLALATSMGMNLLTVSPTKLEAFGRPVIPIEGNYLVFLRCEYCGNRHLDEHDLCDACGFSPRWSPIFHKLRHALQRYGCHKPDCEKSPATYDAYGIQRTKYIPCSCGLDEALRIK